MSEDSRGLQKIVQFGGQKKRKPIMTTGLRLRKQAVGAALSGCGQFGMLDGFVNRW
jgi:hypothetical protein